MVMVASPGATAERPRRATSGWRVGRTLAVSLVGSLVAFGLAGGITAAGSWTGRARLLAICLIYGNCIGLAARFAIPAWLRRFTRRNRLSWWLGRVMALPLLILLGGGLGAGILILIGLIPPSSYVTYVFPYVRGGRTLAAVVSIFMAVTAYEYMRDRLDITSLALRTKERDEAEARRLAAEAQLASLESRVHPHFLFNTLNSIASLIPRDP